MALITSIDGSNHPTGGAATAASVGVETLTGNWTHVGSADVPEGSAASGYLQLPAGESGSLRIDDPADVLDGVEDYWVRLWFYAERSGTLDADGTWGRPHKVVESAVTKLFTAIYLRNETQNPGLSLLVSSGIGGTKTHLSGLGASGSKAVVAFDQWTRMELHQRRHATEGCYHVYLNGVLIGEIAGLDTVNDVSLAELQSDSTLSLPAMGGVRWRVAAPIESRDGNDAPIRPLDTLVPDGSELHRHLVHHWVDATGYEQGRFFRYSGVGTPAINNHASGGVNPERRYYTDATGPTPLDLFQQIEAIDDVGPLPFNKNGWASVVVTDLLVGSDAAGINDRFALVLRDAADTADLVRIEMADGELRQVTDAGTTVVGAWVDTSRYAMVVSLRNTGEAAWALIDLTGDFNSQQTVFAGDLAAWTPQPVGKLRMELDHELAKTQVSSVQVCSWWESVLVDSMAHADANGVTPDLATFNHVARKFNNNRDRESVPGGAYPLRDQWDAQGVGRRALSVVMGRSGLDMGQFAATNLAAMGRLRGAVVWLIDGAAINSLSSTPADDATRDAQVDAVLTDAGLLADTLLAGGNRLVVATCAKRTQGTYNDRAIQAIQMVNAGLVGLAYGRQQASQIELMDWASRVHPHTGLFSPGDDVHLDDAGDETVARLMAESRLVPPDVNDPPVDLSDTGVITKTQDLLKQTLADTPQFRAWVGATNRAQALARIYVDALPAPAGDGGEYTRAELETLRPYALVYVDDDGYQMNLAAMGTANDFTDAGRLSVDLEQDVPAHEQANPALANRSFLDAVSAIVTGMGALAGTAGYLAFSELALAEAPRVTAPHDVEEQGHAISARLAVGWGVQA